MTKRSLALIVLFAVVFSVFSVNVLATEPEVHPDVAAVKEFTSEDGNVVLNEDIRANGCDGAIYAHDGANVTIDGGNIHGIVCKGEACDGKYLGYSMAVYANASTVTINGGTFTNDPDPADPNQSDLIYVKNGAKIYIKGGTFKCITPQWTLNAKDPSDGQIIVTGGKFFEFNPAKTKVSTAGACDVVVPEGYTVVKTFDAELNGWWYEVQSEDNIKEFTSANSPATLNEDVKANGCYGAIYAHDGANVTILGGNIYGQVCADDDYSMALGAFGANTVVTIKGGNFQNDTDGSNHCDLIYVKEGAKVRIEGGTFKCSTPSWTLNSHDSNLGLIEVVGGRFYKFNPATANDEAGDNGNGIASNGKVEVVVPDTHKVVQDGDWFEVVCAHTKLNEHPLKEATITEEGCLPYFECNNCHKLFADKAATKETTKEELILDKLIEVKGTEAIVSDAAVLGAIQDAEGSKVIELPVLEATSTVKEVTVPVASIEAIAAENKELLIETADVTVTLDAKTMDTVANEAKGATKVTIEVVKTEEKILNTAQKDAVKDKEVAVVISAKILADGKEISDFKGGKVTVEIPFKPAEGTTIADYKFIYIDDNGNVTEMPYKYIDGVVVVELEHFSEYAIAKTVAKDEGEKAPESTNPAPAETAAPENDNTPKKGAMSFIGIIAVISIVGLVVLKRD